MPPPPPRLQDWSKYKFEIEKALKEKAKTSTGMELKEVGAAWLCVGGGGGGCVMFAHVCWHVCACVCVVCVCACALRGACGVVI